MAAASPESLWLKISRDERIRLGLAAREATPPAALAAWAEGPDRRDPIELLVEQCAPRVAELVPIKYGRMMSSPFAYYRGSPIVMAHDLASCPDTGLMVQACGDAHLMNFGLFASPERNLLFDVNDFDETHTAPWDWDVKRLAASVVVAGRDINLSKDQCRHAAHAVAASYAVRMHEFAEMRNLDIWYSKVDTHSVDEVVARSVRPEVAESVRKELEKGIRKAQHRTNLEAMPKITELVGDRRRIINEPPLIHHLPEGDEITAVEVFEGYRSTLSTEHRSLLDRYQVVDIALKVVGVGSVGTRCYLMLLLGDLGEDPLFLQIKEAERSVLEVHTVPCEYENQGERVVVGQRMMQAASDVFLGWTTGPSGHHFYVRQLRDMKGSARVEHFDAPMLSLYGALCAWTLARAHARSSGAVRIANYIGTDGEFAEAIAEDGVAYARQNQIDYERFLEAIAGGRIFATPGY
jgi:uncharacterized protein (DUF2252 family)